MVDEAELMRLAEAYEAHVLAEKARAATGNSPPAPFDWKPYLPLVGGLVKEALDQAHQAQ